MKKFHYFVLILLISFVVGCSSISNKKESKISVKKDIVNMNRKIGKNTKELKIINDKLNKLENIVKKMESKSDENLTKEEYMVPKEYWEGVSPVLPITNYDCKRFKNLELYEVITLEQLYGTIGESYSISNTLLNAIWKVNKFYGRRHSKRYIAKKFVRKYEFGEKFVKDHAAWLYFSTEQEKRWSATYIALYAYNAGEGAVQSAYSTFYNQVSPTFNHTCGGGKLNFIDWLIECKGLSYPSKVLATYNKIHEDCLW